MPKPVDAVLMIWDGGQGTVTKRHKGLAGKNAILLGIFHMCGNIAE